MDAEEEVVVEVVLQVLDLEVLQLVADEVLEIEMHMEIKNQHFLIENRQERFLVKNENGRHENHLLVHLEIRGMLKQVQHDVPHDLSLIENHLVNENHLVIDQNEILTLHELLVKANLSSQM